VIPFVVALFAPLMRGNIFRMIIAGTLELIAGFYIATGMADFFTSAAVNAGFAMPEGAAKITSIADGFIWTGLVFTKAVQWLGGIGGLVVLAVIVLALFFFYRKNPKAWDVVAGAPKPEGKK
jgi:PTS system galactitol-specific IIC component